MGRHFCKLCLCSHPLPPISSSPTQAEGEGGAEMSSQRAVDEMLASSGIDPSPLPLSCFEPSQLASSDHVELIVADADFASEHTISRLGMSLLPSRGSSMTMGGGGFWSWVFEAQIVHPPRGWKQTVVSDRCDGNRVVIKMYVEKHGISKRQIIDRWHRELVALGTLSEIEGVARCLGFGFTSDLWPFLVLEHAGDALTHHIRSLRPLPLLPSLIPHLAYTIHTAHTLGLAHNDLHTDNIMLQDTVSGPVTKVIDWNSVEATEEEGGAGGSAAKDGAVVRDCRAVGRAAVACIGGANVHDSIFGSSFFGTCEDWIRAASAVKGSPSIRGAWREVIAGMMLESPGGGGDALLECAGMETRLLKSGGGRGGRGASEVASLEKKKRGKRR